MYDGVEEEDGRLACSVATREDCSSDSCDPMCRLAVADSAEEPRHAAVAQESPSVRPAVSVLLAKVAGRVPAEVAHRCHWWQSVPMEHALRLAWCRPVLTAADVDRASPFAAEAADRGCCPVRAADLNSTTPYFPRGVPSRVVSSNLGIYGACWV